MATKFERGEGSCKAEGDKKRPTFLRLSLYWMINQEEVRTCKEKPWFRIRTPTRVRFSRKKPDPDPHPTLEEQPGSGSKQDAKFIIVVL